MAAPFVVKAGMGLLTQTAGKIPGFVQQWVGKISPKGLSIPQQARPFRPLSRIATIGNETGLTRTAQIRQQLVVGSRRTVAFAEVELIDFHGEVIGYSGEASRAAKGRLIANWEQANPRSAVADLTARNPGLGWQDAEAKLLEHLRNRLSPFDQGTIRLFVDQPALGGVCGNCAVEILRFRLNFPGIDLVVSTP